MRVTVQHIFLSFVFISWGVLKVHAQDNEKQALTTQLKTAKGIQRVDVLNKLFPQVYREKPETAVKYLEEAEKLSKQLQYEKGEIGAGINRVYEQLQKNEFDAAVRSARKWLKICQEKNLVAEQFDLYHYTARAYRDNNKLNECMVVLEEYLAFAIEHKADKQIARAYNEKGIAGFYKGNLEGATENFKRSLAVNEKIGDVKEANGLTMNIGIVLYRLGKLKESLVYYRKALKAFEKLQDTLEMANTLTNIAITEDALGNFREAFDSYQQTAKLYKGIRNMEAYAGVLENIGNSYFNRGEYPGALKYFYESLKIREENKALRPMALSYINISKVYLKMRDTSQAIENTKKALKITVESGNMLDESTCLVQLSELYIGQKMLDEAEKTIKRSVAIGQKTGSLQAKAATYQSLGHLYEVRSQLDSALHDYLLSLDLHTQSGQADAMAVVQSSVGNLYLQKGEYQKAIVYLLEAETALKKLNVKYDLSNNYHWLAQSYEKLGKYPEAYRYFTLFHRESDTLFNETMSKSLAEMQTKYAVEKKQKENELLQKKSELDKTRLERNEAIRNEQLVIIYAILGLVVVFVVLLAVMLKSNVQRKKINMQLAGQNAQIISQKNTIEEKNKDITDSISYARRIQEAILPPAEIIDKYLGDAFVFYQPKDIVSGDFYFVEQTNNKVLFATVDCTGHGVPGAFVSIVGYNGLNRAIKEYKLSKPAEVLNRLNTLVEETLDAHGSGLKDGMDISLCSFDRETKNLEWSGANNPLWIIRQDGELIEVKADKQPIGKYADRKPFTNHHISLNKGDLVYVFSDGYADQFGGPSGKKFKYAQLKDLLISIKDLPMGEQKETLQQSINDWKGKLEQIDDICVMGMRV